MITLTVWGLMSDKNRTKNHESNTGIESPLRMLSLVVVHCIFYIRRIIPLGLDCVIWNHLDPRSVDRSSGVQSRVGPESVQAFDWFCSNIFWNVLESAYGTRRVQFITRQFITIPQIDHSRSQISNVRVTDLCWLPFLRKITCCLGKFEYRFGFQSKLRIE